MPTRLNPQIYARAKEKYKSMKASAYKSGLIEKAYKAMGGKYPQSKRSNYKKASYPKKAKYCAVNRYGVTFCAPVKKTATSQGAKKPGNFRRNKIKKGYSSGSIIRTAASNVAKQKRKKTQSAIKKMEGLRKRRDANRRYVARKKAGKVRKAGTRTGAKYRKKK